MSEEIWLKRVIFILFFCSSFIISQPAFCATSAVEYLCELGIVFYKQGRYNEALSEFNKALMLDFNNQTAKKYIGDIFKQASPPKIAKELPKKLSRENVIKETLDKFTKKEEPILISEEEIKAKEEGLKISGEVQTRLGMTPEDTYWKRANWDLNEKNWRFLSEAAFNRRENTYDARVYDRLSLNLDADNKEGLGFHANITIDPWSFTGKSEKVNLNGSAGDLAQIELKYWSNTGYTINENVNTLDNGDVFSLPEIKVVDGHTSTPVSINSTANNVFTLPEIKIYRNFQPVREFWFDYKQEDLKLRIYPIAYEDQALTFDDPLRLSNNRTWWEDSPWIRSWKTGIYNASATPADFTKGYWDNALSFFARDSEGRRLTSLRGFSFEYSPQEETSFITSVATPKDPWLDYSDLDNFLSATRFKQSITEDLDLGVTATSRLGYNREDRDKLDAWNYLGGLDLGYEIIDGLKLSFEGARSQAKYDITNSDYKSQGRGNAYYFSLLGRFPMKSIMDTENDYNGLQPEKDEGFFSKFRFFASRMDDSFDAPLSSYVETRDDEFWSRHIHFRTPFKYYYQGPGRLLTWDDVKAYRIGNGIDIGRNTLGLRVESSLWDKSVENLFDTRNVHGTDAKFIEQVIREELTWNMNDRLTSKLLGIYNHLHKTRAGTDPFIFDTRLRRFLDNSYIEDDKDPSVTIGSLGLEYEFFDGLVLNGIWEYTNDITLSYDGFPRGILLNDTTRNLTFYENNNKYRDFNKFLYSQQFFPRPPYPYYNIFKVGLKLIPMENLEFYLDYTRNPYEKVGQVDDSMNHIGFEASYMPMPKLSIFLKYNYSRWQDLDKLTQGITKVFGHHNTFAELIYHKSEDEDFAFQYGEGSRDPYMSGVLWVGWDPYGGSLRTIDTQHIIRLYYRRKF